MASKFSEFLHQNMTPYIPDIFVHEHVAADLSLSDLFSKKFGNEEKLREYEAVISCRALSFHNHQPNKVGFLALHRPRMIEIRKQMLENQHKLGIQKFSSFSGQSTTAITTVNAPSVVKIKPRSVESIQLGDLTRFSKYVSHNGAKLDQFDDKRLICDDEETNFESKDEKQNDSLYENDLDISDDSDW